MKSLAYSTLLCMALVTSCQRQTVLVPPEIHYGSQTCAECGMIISDSHYAAALAWHNSSDGAIQTVAFDDIGCLLAWRHHHAAAQMDAVWVKDVRTAIWLNAQSAIFVKSQQLQTPMGWGIAAGTGTNDFSGLPVQKPLLTWAALLDLQNQETNSVSPNS